MDRSFHWWDGPRWSSFGSRSSLHSSVLSTPSSVSNSNSWKINDFHNSVLDKFIANNFYFQRITKKKEDICCKNQLTVVSCFLWNKKISLTNLRQSHLSINFTCLIAAVAAAYHTFVWIGFTISSADGHVQSDCRARTRVSTLCISMYEYWTQQKHWNEKWNLSYRWSKYSNIFIYKFSNFLLTDARET